MKLVKKNQKLHNPDSPLLIGDVNDGDVVMEVNEPSYLYATKVNLNLFLTKTLYIMFFSLQFYNLASTSFK